jgi:hypothetical protein
MSTSADLGIVYIAGQQAQPEVTHNTALNQLQILQTGVISAGLNTPPGSPTQGDTYILGASPTGAWAGRANCLAGYFGTSWVFVPGNDSAGTPIALGARQEGLTVWNKATDSNVIWSGSAWAAPSGGSQLGMASAIASGDVFPMFGAFGTVGTGTPNSTTRLQFYVAEVDAPITVTDVVLAIKTASASQTIDVMIYQFLGCGKPGTCLAKGQVSTTATGKILGTVGTPVTLAAGLYFVAIHATSTSPAFAISTTGTQNLRGITLAVTDGFEYMAASGSKFESTLVNDSALPGGAYTYGMNLTGFTMSSSSIVGYSSTFPLVGLKKQ